MCNFDVFCTSYQVHDYKMKRLLYNRSIFKDGMNESYTKQPACFRITIQQHLSVWVILICPWRGSKYSSSALSFISNELVILMYWASPHLVWWGSHVSSIFKCRQTMYLRFYIELLVSEFMNNDRYWSILLEQSESNAKRTRNHWIPIKSH